VFGSGAGEEIKDCQFNAWIRVHRGFQSLHFCVLPSSANSKSSGAMLLSHLTSHGKKIAAAANVLIDVEGAINFSSRH